VPCVDTKIPLNNYCGGGAGDRYWCADGFRIVYASKTGDVSTVNGYFLDIPDCGSNGSSDVNCQEIWGINTGSFIDVSLKFPTVQNSTDVGPITSDILNIKDSSGNNRSFVASIYRNSTFRPSLDDGTEGANGFIQEPNQICVIEDTSIVGCTERDIPTKPTVLSCDSDQIPAGISCTNNYFMPQFVALMKAGSDITAAMVEPLSVHNTNTNASFNLAGYNFTSFVTDDTYITKPFSGQKSMNSASIYGKYKNNAAPYDNTGRPTNAVYLSGLEYLNDKNPFQE
jgi:hypothetical protein